jgi:AmmeMemoRadiSam system protein B
MDVPCRLAAVAGRFYPQDRKTLLADIESYLSPRSMAKPALGCLAPHAGYLYSGPIAGSVYSRIELPRCALVMCPNHTGKGEPLSIMSQGSWQTPLGRAPIASELAEELKRRFPLLAEDAEAHRQEHAIEVELPFLQWLRPDFCFVPIALATRGCEILEALGEAIAEAVRAHPEAVLLIASSDMNHYESDSVTRAKDQKAIARILALDPRGLFDTVMKENISMCGIGPAVTLLAAANRLGAGSAELIDYATSGDVSGDRERVVGYAGIVVR